MSSKQIGQFSGASTKLKVPSGRQGMLNVDSVRSVSQNLVRLIREAIPREKCSFFNIVQKAFDPHLSFEHHVVNFLKSVFEH